MIISAFRQGEIAVVATRGMELMDTFHVSRSPARVSAARESTSCRASWPAAARGMSGVKSGEDVGHPDDDIRECGG